MKRKLSLLPFAVVISFIILLNWYTLSAIHILISGPFLSPVFWSVIFLVALSLFYSISRMRKGGADLLFKISSHAALILLTAEIVTAAMLLLGDLYSLLFRTPRSIYWIEACFLLMLFTLFIFLYGMIFGKYNYKVISHELYFDDLPPAFDGFKVVQISDIHAGSFRNPAAVRRGIELINAQKADLFVFTGDLVNNSASEIKPWIKLFSEITAPYGQFSVLGNHDYGDYRSWESELAKRNNLEQLKADHAAIGFDLLLDRHVKIHKGGAHFILAGVENWGIGFGQRGDLVKALEGTKSDDFKILLSHDPTHWEAQVKQFPVKVDLTLAGHTHGMQFGLEALGIKWSPVKYRYPHWAGVKTENGRTLNINRGFGFLGFSGRIGIWPEITVIHLKKRHVPAATAARDAAGQAASQANNQA